MATLEKIRSKSVLLIVIIGVALLAFIVGDALTNSRNLFGDQTTVAKIGSDKIDYTEYQQKREELNQQLEQARRQNPQQYANFDTQLLSQMAIDQLITEHLIDDAVKKAGIRTSGEQLRFYIIESGAQIPELSTIIQSLNQNGISAATPQQAYEVIFNPKQNGLTDQQVAPFQRAWLAMEESVKKLVRRQTYQRLLTGTVKANVLDKKALHNDYVSTSRVSLAYMPYGQLNEKEYPVSDSELQTAYNAEKSKFQVQEPTKDVSFISIGVQPSQADRNAAKQLAAKTMASLKDSTQSQLSKDLKKAGLAVEKKALRLNDLANGPVKNFVSAANNGDVQMVTEGLAGFTIIKMGKRYAKVDSIQLNLVQVAGTKLPSQVLQSLNAGLNVDSLTSKFPVDSVMSSPAQWIPLFTAEGATQALQQSQLDSLLNAGGRYIQLMSTPQGSVIAQIAKQSTTKEIVEFEQVDYDLKPSAATMNEARTKLEKFLAANNTAEKFNKAAQKAGYNLQTYSLTSSTPAVPRMAGMQSFYPESRQVVRWVMIDGKPGEVSHIYESKDALHPMLYAVAIDREYDDFIPLANNDVKTYITEKVRRDKAGDKLVKTYKPKATSVANAAKAMGVQAQDSVIVRFGRNNMINDANIAARIAGEKPGKVVVVKGTDGVYVYQIVGKNTENFPYNDQQFEQTYYQQFNPDFNAMLRGTKKFKNNAYKFEAGD